MNEETPEATVEIEVKKTGIVLDASTLTSLMSCARYTDFVYNLNFLSIKGKSNSLETGSLVHKILEVYYRHKIKGFDRNQCIGQALIAGQIYITGCPHCADPHNEKPACGHQPLEYPGVRNTPENSEGNLIGWRWVLQSCELYFDRWKNDFWTPLAAETVRGDVLYEDDEIRILWKAKIDLIVDTTQGIYPVDTKTFKQRRQKTSLNNQFIGQCLVMKTRGVIIDKFGFQTSLKAEERFTREMINYSADRLIEWQSETLPYWAYKYLHYHQTGYWPPNYSSCDGRIYGPCAFKGVCESDRSMREEVLRTEFTIGPKWDPTNVGEE